MSSRHRTSFRYRQADWGPFRIARNVRLLRGWWIDCGAATRMGNLRWQLCPFFRPGSFQTSPRRSCTGSCPQPEQLSFRRSPRLADCFPSSTKMYTETMAPSGQPLRVPFRRVNLEGGRHFDLYDTSGPQVRRQLLLANRPGLGSATPAPLPPGNCVTTEAPCCCSRSYRFETAHLFSARHGHSAARLRCSCLCTA